MEVSGLRALNFWPNSITPPMRSPGSVKLLKHPSSFSRQFLPNAFLSTSSLEGTNADNCLRISGEQKILQIVLVSPQIPGNTGSIARTCAASAVGLHLVGPLGFKVDDAKLKRAGLDYWPYVVVKSHNSWEEFKGYFSQKGGEKRLLAFTKRGAYIHSDFKYKRGDWLVFGSETQGLPPHALLDCSGGGGESGGGTIRIPMVETYVRCLNLSVSVGIALYEAARQLNYEQLNNNNNNSLPGYKLDGQSEEALEEDICG